MHPQREELAAYLDGSLAAPQADRVEGHVQACPECEATLNLLGNHSDTMLDQLRRGAPQNSADAEIACGAMIEAIKDLGRDPTNPGTAAAASPEAAELGSLREYKLLKKLGEGGMGAVYRALHTKLDKIVALKVLPGGRVQNTDAVARFEREMKAVGKLRHPNIVGAFDAGEANGMHFLVMELVDGESLSTLVKLHAPLAVADACELVRQAAVGLEEAREHGMVHRDIKPSNLMLTVEKRKGGATGIVKVLDMGLALLDASQPGGGDLTGTGQLMGTLHYMAPEQANDTHTVDIRADIYSLGVVLYELLTGRIPLEARRNEPMMTKLLALTQEPNPSIGLLRPDLPQPLIKMVDRMLAKNPAERPATPEVVATALEPYAADHHIAGLLDATAIRAQRSAAPASNSQISYAVKPAAATQQVRRGPPQNTVRIAAGFAAAFFFAVLGVWLIVRDKDGNEVGRIQLPEGGSLTVSPGDGKKPSTVANAPAPAPAVTTKPAPVTVPRVTGNYRLSLDGQTQYVEVPSLRFTGTGPYTLEAYITPFSDDPKATFHALTFTGDGYLGIEQKGHGSWQGLAALEKPMWSVGGKPLEVRRRSHVAAQWDGVGIVVFVDGKKFVPLDDGRTARDVRVPELLIGGSRGDKESRPRQLFPGEIDEIRVSKTLRYDRDFTPVERFEPDADTLALYHCDEGSGETLVDASGNNHHGIVVGGAAWKQSVVAPSRSD